ADSVDARKRSRRAPAASRGTTRTIVRTPPPPPFASGCGANAVRRRLPDLGFDVALGLDEDVHERAVVEVLRVELRGDAALVQRAALLDLLRERLEQIVV